MPSDLRAHLRYPEDIFSAQTEQYALYQHHRSGPNTSNKQAIWDVAPDARRVERAPVAQASAARTAAAATRRCVGR